MRLFEHPVARLLVRARGGRPARRRSPSRRASSPRARPSSRRPGPRTASGRRCRASLPSSVSPSESASRFAGSIVSTQTFSPRAAIPLAIAAEVVVLPTPPEPAQMQIPLPSRISPTGHQPSSARGGLDAEVGLEEEGQGLDRGSTRRRSRASWARWEWGAAMSDRPPAPRRRPPWRVLPAARPPRWRSAPG